MVHQRLLIGLWATGLLLAEPPVLATGQGQGNVGGSGPQCVQGVVKDRRFGRMMAPAEHPFFQTAVAVPTRETILTLFNGMTVTALQEANDTTFFDNFQLGHRVSICQEPRVATCADGRRAPALVSVYDEVNHSRALGYSGSDACGQG